MVGHEQLHDLLQQGLAAAPHPLFAGAVCGLDVGSTLVVVTAGHAHRYADAGGALLPVEQQRRVTEETVFDLASVTKLFTATLTLQTVEQGLLDLDEPVAGRLVSYRGGGESRSRVTVRQLLDHTSGLPSESAAWREQDSPSARRAAILAEPLVAPPGSRRNYSCVGYVTLGLLLETVLAEPLDSAVERMICRPLGLVSTGYRPLERQRRPGPRADGVGDVRDLIAATEVRRIDWAPDHDPDDPDGRGVVHDETAAALGGVAGNAGLFAPARDLLRFGRAYLDALRGDASSPLGLYRSTVRELLTPSPATALAPSPGERAAEAYSYGLGWRIDDPSFMLGLTGRGRVYGHPGFTGTSLLLDEDRDLVCVLLTNRVHPSRTWSDLVPFRQRLSALLAGE